MAPLRSLGNPDISPYDDVFCATGKQNHFIEAPPHYGGRGIIFGGGNSNVIQYITIQSTGNSTDFGDLNSNSNWSAGTSSGGAGRAVKAGGSCDLTHMDYITIA